MPRLLVSTTGTKNPGPGVCCARDPGAFGFASPQGLEPGLGRKWSQPEKHVTKFSKFCCFCTAVVAKCIQYMQTPNHR